MHKPLEMSATRRWSIIGLLCLGMMIAYFDRINLSVALPDEDFKNTFRLSQTDTGWLSSAFFWSYTILQIPVGFFVDRFGVRWPYAGGFALWSIISGATAFTNTFRELVTLRLLLGVAECPVTPAGMRWIRMHIAESRRGLAIGMYMAAAKLGPALGAVIATYLITFAGWRNMFLILGFGCMLWLVPWLILVKDEAPKPQQGSAGADKGAAGPSFGRLMASPVILGTIIGTFCYQYFVYFCVTWYPKYFAESRNLNLEKSGLFTGFSLFGMASVAILAGWLADRMIVRGRNPVVVRKAFTIAGFAVASTELIGVFAPSTTVALFFAVFSLSGLGLMTANYWALTQTLMPGAAIGRIVGIQNMAANLPGIVAPLLTGWLVERTGSYNAPMQAIGFFLMLGIASYLFLVREKYVPKGETQA